MGTLLLPAEDRALEYGKHSQACWEAPCPAVLGSPGAAHRLPGLSSPLAQVPRQRAPGRSTVDSPLLSPPASPSGSVTFPHSCFCRITRIQFYLWAAALGGTMLGLRVAKVSQAQAQPCWMPLTALCFATYCLLPHVPHTRCRMTFLKCKASLGSSLLKPVRGSLLRSGKKAVFTTLLPKALLVYPQPIWACQ